MPTDGDWQASYDLLADPATYGLSGKQVDCIDTSISALFLAGDYAYKLRKPVKLNFLDFSTVRLRQRDCERELTLNRRTAPALYLDVLPVTREAGGALSLDGEGTPIEWVVRMRRFDRTQMLDAQADRGVLTPATIERLAANIARFHEALPPEPDWGGAENFARTLALNDAQYRDFAGDIFTRKDIESLSAASKAALDRAARTLDERRQAGWVRHCHGDLHLGNICCLDGVPTPFDCIEFSDPIARIDLLYDLGFLLMDLWHRGLAPHANACLNRYLVSLTPSACDATLAGLGLLPLFLSCRAGVRAFVMARTARSQPDNKALPETARAYFALAGQFLTPVRARLVAVGGLSGTGKSVLARGLAPAIGAAPGAVLLRSDEIRKQLWGQPLTDKLPADAYTGAANEKVYDTMQQRARIALRAGHSVIADAVHARPEERQALEQIAAQEGTRFDGLWLEAPEETLAARVDARRGDASDADARVVRQQQNYPLGEISWHKISAAGTPEDTLARARTALRPPDLRQTTDP